MPSKFFSVLVTIRIHLWLESSGSFVMLTCPLLDILSSSHNTLYHCSFEYLLALFDKEIIFRILFARPEKEGGSP